MSRVHQAIRRAEKENRGEKPLAESPSEGGSLQSVRPGGVVKSPLRSNSPYSDTPTQSEQDKKEIPIRHDNRLVAFSAPRSLPSEQYRTLKTKLFQMRNGRTLRSVLVTSAEPSDGKTLTAVNLALTIAQEIEQRVLLIDCDLRRPSVHKTLGFPKVEGLADFLSQDSALCNIVHTTNIANLCVIPAGTIPENPAELLNTQKMREFLSSISNQFDWVIIDSPPIVPLADSELLSSLVDGTLLVVRAGKTLSESVTKAVHTLKNGKILGIVFNCTQTSRKTNYYYYAYGSAEA